MSERSAGKRFAITIAAIVKNEAPYIAEWIEYHGLLGVEHFYIYDNGSNDGLDEVLRPYCLQGRATLLAWPEFPGQVSAYNHAIKVFGRDSEWMALLDIDEFVHLVEDTSLPKFMDGFAADADQLLLPWVHFGASGHEEKPEGLVIENFVHRVNEPHLQPKTIVRPGAVIAAEVHHCETLNGRTINAAGHFAKERWIQEQPWNGPVRVHHYFTKSRTEFLAKLNRGQADGGRGKDASAFERFEAETFDDSLARFGPAVRAALAATAARPETTHVSSTWSAQSELTPSRRWTVEANAALASASQQACNPRWPDIASRATMETRYLSADAIPIEELHQCASRVADALSARSLLVHHGELRPGAAIRLKPDLVVLGRPYLTWLLSCEASISLELTAEGTDAAEKHWTSHCDLPIPAGENLGLQIMSSRTMHVRELELRNLSDRFVRVQGLQLFSFF